MKHATPFALRASWTLAAVVAFLGAAPYNAASAQSAPATAASGYAKLQGYLTDSVHSGPLAKAVILVEGAQRSTSSDDEGHYVIDSIPAGSYRLQILHPLLDTLGIGVLRTAAMPFTAGTTRDLDLAVPTPERIVGVLCTAAQRLRGPAAMIGFVRDPETKGPAVGSKVQLVYFVADLIGRKQPRVVEGIVDSTGMYKICGLAKDMSGKVQVFRNGVSSGEVPAEVTNGFLALRGFTVASTQRTVEMKGDSGKVVRVAKGSARVTGRVLDKKGTPLVDARVMLQGGGEVTKTKANGTFTLDSLPSGTQALEVRHIGYSVTEVAVELSTTAPAQTTVTMSDAAPLLATMRIEAAVDKGLTKVGYLERKQMGMGYFMDGRMINHESHLLSDALRVAPGLTMSPSGDGRTNVIRDSRNQQGGCVNFYVDNSPYTEMTPGDIDDYIRPDEVVAMEIYHGSQTPPQFSPAGQSGCAAVVIWTQARVGMRHDTP